MSRSSAAVHKLVGARELKTRLGKYLSAVRGGTTLTITDRGVPVARLAPLSTQDRGIDAVLGELEAEGILSRGSGEVIGDGAPAKTIGEPIERTIARDRDERV